MPTPDEHDALPRVNIRGFDKPMITRIKRAATLRDLTMAAYIGRLVEFHDAARALADQGNEELARLLVDYGLETVRG
jgi:hypothetical protein